MSACKCFEEMNARLKPHNAQIAHGFAVDRGLNKLTLTYYVQTEKLDSNIRSKKPPLVVVSHCPFCGVQLADQE